MLMRVGQTNLRDPQAGELVLMCPACPALGVNLPFDWESDPIRKLIYSAMWSGDGNFKLRRRLKGLRWKEAAKSMLGDMGFWAPDAMFWRYINGTAGLPDMPDEVKYFVMALLGPWSN